MNSRAIIDELSTPVLLKCRCLDCGSTDVVKEWSPCAEDQLAALANVVPQGYISLLYEVEACLEAMDSEQRSGQPAKLLAECLGWLKDFP